MTMQRRAEANSEATTADRPRLPPRWPGWPVATAQAVRFYSRLPVPRLPGEDDPHAVPDFRVMPRALPLAALIIAAPAMATLALAVWLGLSGLAAGALAIAVLATTCGAFHEDGLADSADGLFGGQTAERRLEIMKDSRIGSFGATALMLALVLRVGMLEALVERGGALLACAALAGAAGWSRALGIQLLARDAPARAYGAVADVGRPTPLTALVTLLLAATLALGAGAAGGLPLPAVALALALGYLAMQGLRRLALRLIGGPTGDIAGATQQLAEIAFYLGLLLAPGRAA